MDPKCEPRKTSPIKPAMRTDAPTAPMRVMGSAARIPVMSTTKNPGASRGNSSHPRVPADILNVSERKLLNVESNVPPAPAIRATVSRNRTYCFLSEPGCSILTVILLVIPA